MLYGKEYGKRPVEAPCCGSTNRYAERGNCEDCYLQVCSDCAGCEINEKFTCKDCLEDLLEPGTPDEEECTCEQVDVDRVDVSGCGFHRRVM